MIERILPLCFSLEMSFRAERSDVKDKYSPRPEDLEINAEVEVICRPVCKRAIEFQDEVVSTESPYWIKVLNACYHCLEKSVYSLWFISIHISECIVEETTGSKG